MAIVRKGFSISLSEDDDTVAGVLIVNKITAVVEGGAGAVTLREGGAAGIEIMKTTGLAENTTPSLLTFSIPQRIEDLFAETTDNATIIVHIQ